MAIELRTRELKGKNSTGKFTFYIDVYLGDKRWTETIPGVTMDMSKTKEERDEIKKLIQQIFHNRSMEILNDENNLASKHKRNNNFIEYFEELKKKKQKDKTKENWSSVLKHLIDYAGKQVKFKRIDEKWLEGFIKHLQKNVASNNSVNTYFTKIVTALNQAVKEKIIISNPAVNVSKPKKEDTETMYLTKAELELIANTDFDDTEVKMAFLFSCYTGLRISDIKKLKWEEIQKQVFDGKVHTVINFKQKKTSDRNYLPLSKQSIELLKKQSKINEFVFQLSAHSKSINRILKRLVKKAGIKKHITFHCGRHTNATVLLSTGKVDLFQVSRLLGHRDIRSTERYAKLTNAAKINAVNNFPTIKIK